MKINQTAGRCILACLLVFLLVQIYYLSSYLIPASPQEPWEELSVLYLVQSVFVTACICAVFFVQLWERVRRDAASPFARLLLVNGDGQVKKEVLLQGRYSFAITGKKNGREVFVETSQILEPGRYLYGTCNLVKGRWYLEAAASDRPIGLKRECDNVIYRLKKEMPYLLLDTDVIYADTYKIIFRKNETGSGGKEHGADPL